MIQRNGGTNVPVGSGAVQVKKAGAVEGGIPAGSSCRELLQGSAPAEVELLEAAQLPEPFGEWWFSTKEELISREEGTISRVRRKS